MNYWKQSSSLSRQDMQRIMSGLAPPENISYVNPKNELSFKTPSGQWQPQFSPNLRKSVRVSDCSKMDIKLLNCINDPTVSQVERRHQMHIMSSRRGLHLNSSSDVLNQQNEYNQQK